MPSEISPGDFAASWLAFVRSSPAGGVVWNLSEWVSGTDLSWAIERPDDLWVAIIEIVQSDLSSWEEELLGSGPLETLLRKHYERFAEYAFSIAAGNQALLSALTFVNPPESKETEFDRRVLEIDSARQMKS